MPALSHAADQTTRAEVERDTVTSSQWEETTRPGHSTRDSAAAPNRTLLAPGQTFGPRYEIKRLLGQGGMGAVYEAIDLELGVPVALKVIRPEITADPAAAAAIERRFKRELLLARQVTHRNVVRIHDLGDVEGTRYISMSYIEGADLATILRREGVLPVARALRIARSVASGLLAAHQAGVVHRDLKPGNVMIDADGEALIMDFGIAQSTGLAATSPARDTPQQSPPATWLGHTMTGAVVGTVPYMAPEQARGGVVDQRADLYAFGLIAYDMLTTTRRARYADNAHAELVARMEAPPAGLPSLEPRVPAALDRIIGRCLQPDPADRYQISAELATALDRLDAEGRLLPVVRRVTRRQIVASVVAVLALLAATWWAAQPPPAPVERAPMSVLITDFENRTGDPVFEGTLEEALNVGIEGASFINAYPRTDAQRLLRQSKPGSALDEPAARLIALREGINVILAGSISLRSGRAYTISVRAIDPAADGSEATLATVTISASGRDEVLQAMQSLAERLRRALGDTTPEDAGGREMFTTASLDAARYYSIAQNLQTNYKDEEAIDYYRRAAELDPNFGRAYGGWAHSASRLGRHEESEELWKKSLALIDRMTEREKYRTLGIYYGTVTRNYEKAIETYATLVKLYPADGAGHNNLALAYFNTLDFQKALEAGRRVLEIYPRKLLYRSNYALFAMYAGDFGTAESEGRTIVEQNPEYYPAYLPVAVGALGRGDRAAAENAYGGMAKTGAAGSSIAVMGQADVALNHGGWEEAIEKLRAGIAEDERQNNQQGLAAKWTALGEAYAALGRRSLAIEAAERAIQLAGPTVAAVPAARVLIAQGREERAATLAAELGQQLQPQSRAYARILEGELALQRRRRVEAVEAFQSAQKTADLWLGRFLLGVAYIESNYHAEALLELELCQKRRGEAAAILLDDVPSFRYLAPLQYWLGRAHEGLGAKDKAAEHYKAYLTLRGSGGDSLAADVRQRLRQL